MQSHPNSTLVVRKTSDLESLSRARGAGLVPRVSKIVFDLEHVERSRQLAWERRLNSYLNRCGCTAGSIVTLVSLGITMVQLVRSAGDQPILLLAFALPAGVLLSTLAGLVAKLLTLRITRTQIQRTVKSILSAA